MKKKLKVLFTFSGLRHYNNFLLNKINKLPEVEVSVVIPANKSKKVGPGVYTTDKGVEFKCYRLNEYTNIRGDLAFRRLLNLIIETKPDIIVVIRSYTRGIICNPILMGVIKAYGIKLILKDHPFRLLTYDAAKEKIRADNDYRAPVKIKLSPIRLLEKIIHQNKILTYTNRSLHQLVRFFKRTSGYYHLFQKKRLFSKFDAFICYVEEATEIFGSYGVPAHKIFISYNSPDTDILLSISEELQTKDPILPANEYRIIHVGRLIRWKRVDLLIHALSHVKKVHPTAELMIIGSGPLENELKKLTVTLGLDSSVRFLGGVHDPESLGQYLTASTLYVLAGMGGLSINDAMCFGLPIICSVCDGTEKKLVRDEYNGKYFIEGDLNDLVDKILFIFSDTGRRKLMGEHSKEIIKKAINIHTVIKGYCAAFDHVSGGRNN